MHAITNTRSDGSWEMGVGMIVELFGVTELGELGQLLEFWWGIVVEFYEMEDCG